jgi:signal transduction histidine kinase
LLILALYVHFLTILLELDVVHADAELHQPLEAEEEPEFLVVVLVVVFVVVVVFGLGFTIGILKSG